MKDRVVEILLTVIIVFVLILLISSIVILNKYNNIAKNIDKRINDEKIQIKIKEEHLSQIKQENSIKKDQLNNSSKYIDTLKEELKKYEK
ncbi:MAG: hypothetical protein J6O62_00305 [Bacilli bacterium]|nr:hypothetical protein [Bacilli bacterium]